MVLLRNYFTLLAIYALSYFMSTYKPDKFLTVQTVKCKDNFDQQEFQYLNYVTALGCYKQ